MKKAFILVFFVILCNSCSESLESYKERTRSFKKKLIEGIQTNISVIGITHETWRSIIFDKSYLDPISSKTVYCDDFNEGLLKIQISMDNTLQEIESKNIELQSEFEEIKDAPKDARTYLENLRDLHGIYENSYKMALSPTGSLMHYTQRINLLAEDFTELKSKLDL